MKQLTVAQLIEQLQTFPSNLKVYIEGCDCIGEAAKVIQDDDDDYIMITRTDSGYYNN